LAAVSPDSRVLHLDTFQTRTMIIVISPSKALDYETPGTVAKPTQPALLKRSQQLVDQLKKKSSKDLQKLLGISEKLADLNVERYAQWSRPFRASNAKPAVLAFKGDVYLGLEADTFTAKQLEYAQEHLLILSGLYGILRPLDLIQPYRLDMGTRLPNAKGKNLYEFWGSELTDKVEKQHAATRSKILVNLASNEYAKALKLKDMDAEVITPVFRDWSNGQYRMIGFFAKKARGRMAAWLLKGKVKSRRKLESFNLDGYAYSAADSSASKPVFLRKQ
jgi:cytoplasmic iron level regulating protein YaaA (DUF328/UPF0246 family)